MSTPLESKTEYFAKRKAIRAAIQFFLTHPKAHAYRVLSMWNDEDENTAGHYDVVIKKAQLIRLTFNFMVKKNEHKLFDSKYWDKNRVEKMFDKLREAN